MMHFSGDRPAFRASATSLRYPASSDSIAFMFFSVLSDRYAGRADAAIKNAGKAYVGLITAWITPARVSATNAPIAASEYMMPFTSRSLAPTREETHVLSRA